MFNCSVFFVLDFLSPVNLALLKIFNNIYITLNHFQFICLLQLHKKIEDLINLIEADKIFFSNINNNVECVNNNLSILFFCNIELVIVFYLFIYLMIFYLQININLILPIGSVPLPYNMYDVSSMDEKSFMNLNSLNLG